MRRCRRIGIGVLLAAWLLGTAACGGGEKPPVYAGAEERPYEIVAGSSVPYKVNEKIYKEKKKAFQFTYRDKENMYVAIGYGEQPTGGFGIRVLTVRETEESILIETELVAPEAGEVVTPAPFSPYLVLKMAASEKSVRFIGTPAQE